MASTSTAPHKARLLLISALGQRYTALEALLQPFFGCYKAESLHDSEQLWPTMHPQLVLLDPALPDGDGLRWLEAQKQNPERRDVPIIVMSYNRETAFLAKALDAGAADYLAMPCDPVEVLARLRLQLRRIGFPQWLAAQQRGQGAQDSAETLVSHSRPEVLVLGAAKVLQQGSVLALGSSRAVALLAYLHEGSGEASRRDLVNLLWPEYQARQADGVFRALLSRLRKVLPQLLVIDTHSVRLQPVADWDSDTFRALLHSRYLQDRQRAAALYRGEFLADVDFEASEEFGLWLEERRSLYAELYQPIAPLQTS